MNEVKSLVESRTFWGAAVALVGSAASLGHYTLSPADAAQAVELISGIITAIGGLIAIWGRVAATKKIESLTPVVLLLIGGAVLAACQGPVLAQSIDTACAKPSCGRVATLQAKTSLSVRHVATPAASMAASGAKLMQTQAQKNPILVLQQFSLTDLQAALADAQAQTPPDTIAAGCYQALITVIQNPIANPLPSSPGLFKLLQKGRDLKAAVAAIQANNGPLTPVATGCAPLVLDAQNTLIQIGIMTGAIAAGSGLTLPLPIPLGDAGSGSLLAWQRSRDRWITAASAETTGPAVSPDAIAR